MGVYERVNPSHPDKLADRIAGAMVDMAYGVEDDPKVAVEVLIGHGRCFIISESSVAFDWLEVKRAVERIANTDEIELELVQRGQDEHLAGNQANGFKCGDNGIFKGCPISYEHRRLTDTMRDIYQRFPCDGKAVLDDERIILCQSRVEDYHNLLPFVEGYSDYLINPLGPWMGGLDVDTGATNRKLGSDMGEAVTGGGIHGKDLSKADVSVNIACHILAQAHKSVCTASCAIGDEEIMFRIWGKIMPITASYEAVVQMAKNYVSDLGGFERLAEWGLI